MSIALEVLPGYIFAPDERVTYAKLNALGSKPMLPLSMTHQTGLPVLAQCHAQLAGQIMATYAVRDPRTKDEC